MDDVVKVFLVVSTTFIVAFAMSLIYESFKPVNVKLIESCNNLCRPNKVDNFELDNELKSITICKCR